MILCKVVCAIVLTLCSVVDCSKQNSCTCILCNSQYYVALYFQYVFQMQSIVRWIALLLYYIVLLSAMDAGSYNTFVRRQCALVALP